MKTALLFVGALLVLGFVLWNRTERFQPEFLDKAQVRRTVGVENSSYDQETNHMSPAGGSLGPVAGTPTPFQVNQYRAHIQ